MPPLASEPILLSSQALEVYVVMKSDWDHDKLCLPPPPPPTHPHTHPQTIRPIFWSNRPKAYLHRTLDWDTFPSGR
jgi:hypothetical protein